MRTCDQCLKTKTDNEFFKSGRGGTKRRRECISCSKKFTELRRFNRHKHAPAKELKRPCSVFTGYLFAGDVA